MLDQLGILQLNTPPSRADPAGPDIGRPAKRSDDRGVERGARRQPDGVAHIAGDRIGERPQHHLHRAPARLDHAPRAQLLEPAGVGQVRVGQDQPQTRGARIDRDEVARTAQRLDERRGLRLALHGGRQ